ncbi:LD-carboxypeptidase [Lacticaseibacillus casei]|uniref:S66 family peptidase n=1 Tax=Lacticaseibacillus TaxID=2759736 RepID=UPI0006687084|nr:MULTISPECIES: S66 peptidase family protein [Lacticaseibacillus]QVI36301.1 LD-carboxypeptidase [Lacticaseibacillus casei]QXG58100.1 LD-carboxypeptidase [Lacticaseibacillus casei]WFB42180.1 LD-carboxypeptidase [Lacticaseibacillus huelsenbergensis]
MIKPPKLHQHEQVAIVSLSAGTLGEAFAAHQRELGTKRLEAMGLVPRFMPNALRGQAYLKAHPEARAADLKTAMTDPDIKGIICAIGGDDTYRIVPYLLDDPEFIEAVKNHPKIFTGFSDTTIDHLMFYQLGMTTFYGPNFLNDLAELDKQLLPYTAASFHHFFENPATTAITSSPTWYEERTDFSADQLGVPRKAHHEQHGYLTLRGHGRITGTLLGGCLDSLHDLLYPVRYSDEPQVAEKYHLFPQSWADKILFIETSEEKIDPTTYRQFLRHLDDHGVLQQVRAILVGKPQNETYFTEYQQVLLDVTASYQTPILYNLNFGHAYPRTILPYGLKATVDFDQRQLTIDEPYFA